MPRLSQVEVYDLRVQTLTPIHIGSNEFLSKFDYIHHGEWLYVVDHDKLLRELESSNLEQRYLKELESRPISLNEFLKRNGFDLGRFAEKVMRYRVRFRGQAGPDGFGSMLKTFIRMVDDSVYLPGSSLKGSLRTSLIYGILRNDPNLRSKLLQEIKNDKKVRGAVVEKVLRLGGRSFESDLLRLLRPSDLYPEKSVETFAAELLTMSLRNGGIRNLGYVEVIPAGAVFHGSLHVFMNQKVMENVARKDMVGTLVGDLVSMMNERSQAVLKRDVQRLRGLSNAGGVVEWLNSVLDEVSGAGGMEAVTSLGFGQGYWKTTVTLAFEGQERMVFGSLGDRRLKHADPVRFPSSMRLVREQAGGEPRPLGWVKLSFRR
jgi:CRISPR type III-A-associated RAMP protein Csm5